MRDALPSENDLGTNELFERVLEDLRSDEESRLGPLVALHGRPTRAVIDRSLALCASPDSAERTVGLRVLRELKHQTVDRQLLWNSIEPVVVRLANEDEDSEVVRWAISCLGCQATGPVALTAVLDRADHPDPGIRFAVAAALPYLLDPAHLEEAPVEALVKLTEDDDADVRAYALMGLVNDLGLADDKREVVKARLADTDDQIRRVARNALKGTQQ
ncbi:MAG: hypothetical protein GY745_17545 [Actinomycetia bacterium]|nr:hypothetical protein [Actinomycetes bacterium]